MRRMLIAVSVALAGLTLVAPAHASVLDTYQRLAARELRPAPLVPTTVPSTLSPADRTIGSGPTRGARGYAIRIVHEGPDGPDAIIALAGGEFRSLKAILRDHRRAGFRAPRRTRIRGRRGYLLTRRLGPLLRSLVWVERGVVYSISSGTPKKVSLAQLRATARGLERLEREWFGSASDPDNSSEAFAVTTKRTVTTDVTFEAKCTVPGSTEPTIRVGEARVTLMRRQGSRFAFDIAEHPCNEDDAAWAGTATGTISPTGITLNLRATATIDGYACDTGPVTLTLDRRLS